MSNISNIFETVKKAGKQELSNFIDFVNPDLSDFNIYSDYFKRGINFVQFSSLKDSFDFLQKIRKDEPNQEALGYVDEKQFKEFSEFEKSINSNSPEFLSGKKITENIIDNIKTFINIGGLYKHDKIVITEDKRGVFDFGLASLGLFRPIEFYSEELKKDIESKSIQDPYKIQKFPYGVVNPDDVKREVFNDQNVYTIIIQNKQYSCEKRQKGTTNVYNNFSDICYLDSNNDGIVLTYNKKDNKVFNGKGKIRLKYASSNKKSYLIYNKKEENAKYVDIFIPINQLRVMDDARVIAVMTPLIVAGALEEYGVKVRISAMRIGSDSSILTSISMALKDYDESVKDSFNKILNLLGKESGIASYFHFFKIYFQQNSTQTRKQSNEGAYFDNIGYNDQRYMDEMMQRYKNWSIKNKGESFINTKVENPNFQFAVKQEVESESNTITYDFVLKNLHGIFFKFYYYMDFLALEMISIQDFVSQISRRFTDDKSFNSLFEVPTDLSVKKSIIRNYVLKMLVEKYSYVIGGDYEDSDEMKAQKEENFKSKLTLLDEALNSL